MLNGPGIPPFTSFNIPQETITVNNCTSTDTAKVSGSGRFLLFPAALRPFSPAEPQTLPPQTAAPSLQHLPLWAGRQSPASRSRCAITAITFAPDMCQNGRIQKASSLQQPTRVADLKCPIQNCTTFQCITPKITAESTIAGATAAQQG